MVGVTTVTSMGLLDRITGSTDDPEWGIVVRDATDGGFASPPGEIETDDLRWPEPISEDEFRRVIQEDYGEELDPTCYYKHIQLAGEDAANKWDFDSVAWEIEPDEEETELAKKLDRMESKVDKVGADSSSGPDVNLADVDNTDELEAKMKGVILQQGIDQHADSIDDLVRLLDTVQDDPPDGDDPMSMLMDNVDTNMRVNSLSDAALFMTLMQGQDQITDLLGKVNGALDSGGALASLMASGAGGGGASGGGASGDEVRLSKSEYRELVSGGDAVQAGGDGGGEGDDGGFSMDDYTDDGGDGRDDAADGGQTYTVGSDAVDPPDGELPMADVEGPEVTGMMPDVVDTPEEQIDDRYRAETQETDHMNTDDPDPMSASPADQDDVEATEEA